MARKRCVALLIVLAVVAVWVGAGAGMAVAAPVLTGAVQQTYNFGVPLLVMEVTVQPDGSAAIIYDITFENYGSPIDIVDIGTPNDDYDVGRMEASIDGAPLTDIRPSEVIDVGVEVHLVDHAILAGGTGTLHIEFAVPDLVYADTTNEENASFQITPTWFDGGAVRGTGDIEIRVATLPGVDPEAVLYQDVPFADKIQDEAGRVVAVWRFEDVVMTEAHRVGVSFPREGFTQIKEITFWDLLGRWLAGILPVVGGVLMFCLPIAAPLFIVFVVIRAVVRAFKPDYLPPIAQVEGGGIKRGLTAPEAAALLELPLTKVMGLVVFGMLEKGLIRQTKEDPLQVEVVEVYRTADRADLANADARADFRREIARENGTVIHQYENPFLDLFEAHPNRPVNALPIIKPMQTLVDGMAAKMKGFDLSDTQDYYRRVIERAAQQAEAIGDIGQREAYLDQYLPWVMMRPNYRPALSVGGYNYWPVWARPSAVTPTAAGGASLLGGGGKPAGTGARPSTTTFGDVSSSFAGWAETTMGGMAAAILPTALSKPVVSSGGGGSSGGSSHSSCACACAGCACACACAGGGR